MEINVPALVNQLLSEQKASIKDLALWIEKSSLSREDDGRVNSIIQLHFGNALYIESMLAAAGEDSEELHDIAMDILFALFDLISKALVIRAHRDNVSRADLAWTPPHSGETVRFTIELTPECKSEVKFVFESSDRSNSPKQLVLTRNLAG